MSSITTLTAAGQSFLDFTASNSWTHTPSATPNGAIVMIAQTTVATDRITAVTYGGVAMARIPNDGFAADTVTEPGAVYMYFLAAPPSGAQTVAVTVGTGTEAKTGWAVTFSGNSALVYTGSAKVQVDTVSPNPTVSGNVLFTRKYAVCSVFYSGLAAPSSITNSWGTQLTGSAAGGRDFGNQSAVAAFAALFGIGAASCGWTAAVDDTALITAFFEEADQLPFLNMPPMLAA